VRYDTKRKTRPGAGRYSVPLRKSLHCTRQRLSHPNRPLRHHRVRVATCLRTLPRSQWTVPPVWSNVRVMVVALLGRAGVGHLRGLRDGDRKAADVAMPSRSRSGKLSPSTFIDRSHLWQVLYLTNETCEQGTGIVPSPRQSDLQRHV
jgi:hypothetical protein